MLQHSRGLLFVIASSAFLLSCGPSRPFNARVQWRAPSEESEESGVLVEGPNAMRRQIKIAVAFALETGAKDIVGLFKQCEVEPGTITVIVGTSFHITEPDALRTQLDYGIKLRVFRGGHTYHPKVYCFEH